VAALAAGAAAPVQRRLARPGANIAPTIGRATSSAAAAARPRASCASSLASSLAWRLLGGAGGLGLFGGAALFFAHMRARQN
jgi:hypothetical protein